jgi:putative acetyltransferase
LQKSHIPAIVALVTRTLAEFGVTFGVGSSTDEQLMRLPESYEKEGGRFFIAELDRALLGTAGIIPKADGRYELRKMYLDPSSRRRGVSQALLDACIAFASERRALCVVVDTTEQMTGAIRFYEKNGFVRDDDQITAARCSRGYRLDLPI